MSANLNITAVAGNQNQKEVTINAGVGALDAALTETLTVDVTSGNVSISDANFRAAIRQLVDGADTAGRTVTVPAIKRFFHVASDPSNTETFDLVRGSTSYTMQIGSSGTFYTDGTANGLVAIAGAGSITVLTTGEVGIGGEPATNAALTLSGTSAEALRIVNTGTSSPFFSIYEGANRRAFLEYQVGSNILRLNAEESGSDLVLMAANAEVIRIEANQDIKHTSNVIINAARHFQLRSYTFAGLPSVGTAELIYVSDDIGGAVPAFSDGTDWRRVTDRAIVSDV